jgi:hypothetical protein
MDLDPRDVGEWLRTRAQEVPADLQSEATALAREASRMAEAFNRQGCQAAVEKLKKLGPQMPRAHHYVPQFYLRAWTGDDGQLWETKIHREKRTMRRCHPSQTAFVEHLYSFREGLMVKQQNPAQFETNLLGPIDDQAAVVHRRLLGGETALAAEERKAWACFAMSLRERHPKQIKANEAAVKATGLRIMKERLEAAEDDASRMRWMQGFRNLDPEVTSRNAVLVQLRKNLSRFESTEAICSMTWKTSDRTGLLTCDAPLLLECTDSSAIKMMALALSPEKLLVMHARWAEYDADELALRHNEAIFRERPSIVYSREPLTPEQERLADEFLVPVDYSVTTSWGACGGTPETQATPEPAVPTRQS